LSGSEKGLVVKILEVELKRVWNLMLLQFIWKFQTAKLILFKDICFI